VELMPPAVATALAGPGATHGVPVDGFCDAALAGIDRAGSGGPLTVGYGMTATPEIAARLAAEAAMFDRLAPRFPVPTYAAAS
jgi:uncharacterized oxidoreductase